MVEFHRAADRRWEWFVFEGLKVVASGSAPTYRAAQWAAAHARIRARV